MGCVLPESVTFWYIFEKSAFGYLSSIIGISVMESNLPLGTRTEPVESLVPFCACSEAEILDVSLGSLESTLEGREIES